MFSSFLIMPEFFTVDLYYSWEYIANMSANIKIEIISVASKKGDYI